MGHRGLGPRPHRRRRRHTHRGLSTAPPKSVHRRGQTEASTSRVLRMVVRAAPSTPRFKLRQSCPSEAVAHHYVPSAWPPPTSAGAERSAPHGCCVGKPRLTVRQAHAIAQMATQLESKFIGRRIPRVRMWPTRHTWCNADRSRRSDGSESDEEVQHRKQRHRNPIQHTRPSKSRCCTDARWQASTHATAPSLGSTCHDRGSTAAPHLAGPHQGRARDRAYAKLSWL